MAITLRPMTDDEFEVWQVELAEAFVAEATAAGRVLPADAVEREKEENARLLPQRSVTPRMLVRVGVDGDGAVVGRVWAGLDHPRGTPGTAFLYDIEVREEFRGRGVGHELLAAIEAAVLEAGVGAMELNVFGNNPTAIHLYSSSGWTTMSQQLRKTLG